MYQHILPARAAALVAIFLVSITACTGQGRSEYSAMSPEQKTQFVQTAYKRLLSDLPPGASDDIDPAGTERIIRHLDEYVARKPRQESGCGFGDDLASLLRRGSSYSPVVATAFERENMPVLVGLYVAMVESEFCPCLQAPTGPLGMFQFTAATGRNYCLETVVGATPSNPDDRCDVRRAAGGAARYFNQLTRDFGSNRTNIAFAVAAYNSGEGGMKARIKEYKDAKRNAALSFWRLSTFVMTERDKWVEAQRKKTTDPDDDTGPGPAKQFKMENVDYVPRFFAAAIAGENPKVFGVNLPPLTQSRSTL